MTESSGRFSSNSLRRLISSLNSIRFRDESGEVEYFGQKVVLLRRDVFGLIGKELSRIAGEAASVILGLAGRRVGVEEGKALVVKAEVLGLKSPDSFPEFVKTAVEETNMGIGKLRVTEMTIDGRVSVLVQNGFEVENSSGSLKPACFFTLGYLEGVFSQLLGRDVRGRETECKSRGDDFCKFDMTSHDHVVDELG